MARQKSCASREGAKPSAPFGVDFDRRRHVRRLGMVEVTSSTEMVVEVGRSLVDGKGRKGNRGKIRRGERKRESEKARKDIFEIDFSSFQNPNIYSL